MATPAPSVLVDEARRGSMAVAAAMAAATAPSALPAAALSRAAATVTLQAPANTAAAPPGYKEVLTAYLHRMKRLIRRTIRPTYYKLFLLYMISVVFISAGMFMWFEGSSMTFINALILSTAAFCQAGLSSVDLSTVTPQTNIWAAITILLGSPIIQTLAPLMLRRLFFDPSKASRLDLLEMHAVRKLVSVILIYYYGLQIVAFFILSLWVSQTPYAISVLTQNNSNIFAWSAFTTISTFHNCGLLTLSNGMVPFYASPLPLIITSTLCLFGETMFPTVLRNVIWLVSKTAAGYDRLAYNYLLENSRRVYTHMFPQRVTIWLWMVTISVNLTQVIFFMALNWNTPAFNFMNTGQKILNAYYMSTTSRKAGVASINIADLSYGMLALYIGVMYLSTSPVVVAVRSSSTRRKAGVLQQARGLLTQDSLYLFILFVVIFAVESTRIATDPNFSGFSVIFELISAYGTIGLSLGYPGTNASFCSVWDTAPKCMICIAMLMGRIRGFPDEDEPAVRIYQHPALVMPPEPGGADNVDDEEKIRLLDDDPPDDAAPLFDGRPLPPIAHSAAYLKHRPSSVTTLPAPPGYPRSSPSAAALPPPYRTTDAAASFASIHGRSPRRTVTSGPTNSLLPGATEHHEAPQPRPPSIVSEHFPERAISFDPVVHARPLQLFQDDVMLGGGAPVQDRLGPIPPPNLEITVEVDEHINDGAPFLVVRNAPTTSELEDSLSDESINTPTSASLGANVSRVRGSDKLPLPVYRQRPEHGPIAEGSRGTQPFMGDRYPHPRTPHSQEQPTAPGRHSSLATLSPTLSPINITGIASTNPFHEPTPTHLPPLALPSPRVIAPIASSALVFGTAHQHRRRISDGDIVGVTVDSASSSSRTTSTGGIHGDNNDAGDDEDSGDYEDDDSTVKGTSVWRGHQNSSASLEHVVVVDLRRPVSTTDGCGNSSSSSAGNSATNSRLASSTGAPTRPGIVRSATHSDHPLVVQRPVPIQRPAPVSRPATAHAFASELLHTGSQTPYHESGPSISRARTPGTIDDASSTTTDYFSLPVHSNNEDNTTIRHKGTFLVKRLEDDPMANEMEQRVDLIRNLAHRKHNDPLARLADITAGTPAPPASTSPEPDAARATFSHWQ